MLGQGAGQVLSLVIFLVIARFVTQASFGIVAVSLASVEFIRRVLLDPITFVVTAKPRVEERDFSVCFSLLLVLSAAVTVLLIAFAPFVASLIRSPQAGSTLRSVSVILFGLGIAGAQGAWLVRRMQFRALALRSIASVVAGGIVGIAMALNGFDLWSLVAQQVTINLSSGAILWLTSGWRPRFTLSWSDARESFRSARHISMSAIWTSIANDADLFFASAFFGPAAAGVYNAGKRILLTANLLLVNTISAVTLPILANLEHDRQRGASFLDGLRMASVGTAPAFLGLAVASDDLVHVILGPNWLAVGPIITAMAFSGYAFSIGQFATSVLLVAQRAHLDSRTSAISALLNVVAFILVIRFGPVALAATVSITTLCVVPIRVRFALKELSLHWPQVVEALVPSVIASLAMAVGVVFLRALLPAEFPAIVRLVCIISGGILVYALWLRVFSPALFRNVLNAIGEATGMHFISRSHNPD